MGIRLSSFDVGHGGAMDETGGAMSQCSGSVACKY